MNEIYALEKGEYQEKRGEEEKKKEQDLPFVPMSSLKVKIEKKGGEWGGNFSNLNLILITVLTNSGKIMTNIGWL